MLKSGINACFINSETEMVQPFLYSHLVILILSAVEGEGSSAHARSDIHQRFLSGRA